MFEETLKAIGPDSSLLLVDDDEVFANRLARAMEKRGFKPQVALSVSSAKEFINNAPPAYAVIDLRLEDGNGLGIVDYIRVKRPEARVIILTGYGAISTPVAAVKLGFVDFYFNHRIVAAMDMKAEKLVSVLQ